MSLALYPGSFDPITYGHLDVINRALKIFDGLRVAVAHNLEKNPLFTVEERVAMLRETAGKIKGVEVDSFEGLLVEYARRCGAKVIVRGLRALSDFEYEFQMALTNRKIYNDIETVFLMPSEQFSYLSSRMIKEIVSLGGDVSVFVPDVIYKKLKSKVNL
jgi:pantetheine-phosphate adenylyltransferase